MKIYNLLRFVYNGLLTGLPSLTYNPFTKKTFLTEFSVYPSSTYINYKIDKVNFEKINKFISKDFGDIFDLDKVKLENNDYDYYLSVNVYNCSIPIIPKDEPITRLEVNTYVKEKSNNKIGTLLIDYLSNELSMDPVNIFKSKVSEDFYFKISDNKFSIYSDNENIKINSTFKMVKDKFNKVKPILISDDLLKYSDNIYYRNGIYDKLFYDSSLTYSKLQILDTVFNEFQFYNMTFSKPEFVFCFKNDIKFCGGMWDNVNR